MKIEYRLIEVIEINGLGDKRYYYKIESRKKLLFELIKFPWSEYKYPHIDKFGTVEIYYDTGKCLESRFIFDDYKKAEDVLNCLKTYKDKLIFPAIRKTSSISELVFRSENPEVPKFGKYFGNLKDAIDWINKNHYSIHRKTILK